MIPYTGLAYVMGSLAFGFLAFRFYQYYTREASVFSKMMLFFALSFLAFTVYTAAATLFFSHSSEALKSAIVAATFFQGLGNSFLAYLIVFMKVPRVSPRAVFAFFLLATLATTFVAITSESSPFLDENSGAVDWGVPAAEDLPRAVIFLLVFVPMGFIFVEQYFSSRDPEVRLRAFGLGSLLVLGALAASVDLVLEQQLSLGLATGDIAQIIIYAVLLALLIVTQRPPRPKYVKEV